MYEIALALWRLAFTPWFNNSTLNLASFIGICAAAYFVTSCMKALCERS